MGVSLSSEARLCKLRCGNQAKSDCAPFLYTSVDCITNTKGCFPNPNSCKVTEHWIPFCFSFFPWFCFPFHFYALRFALLSCTPQSTGEKEDKFSSYVSMFINKLLPQHFWLQEITNLTPLLGRINEIIFSTWAERTKEERNRVIGTYQEKHK